jgi:predicted aspartyl protease
MPIDSFPFIRAYRTDPKKRPWLFIRVKNPDTGHSFPTAGLVDTGADECCLPASYADLLGHNLTAGTVKKINTGNGITTAYGHTCTVEILDTNLLFQGKERIVHTIEETLIDFMPNLHCALLGVRTFLNQFVLTIDYPKEIFSIRRP